MALLHKKQAATKKAAKSAPPRSDAAIRQHEYRQRMKAQGYTPRVIWLPAAVPTPSNQDLMAWATKFLPSFSQKGSKTQKMGRILNSREIEGIISLSIENSALQAVCRGAQYMWEHHPGIGVLDFITAQGCTVAEVVAGCPSGAAIWDCYLKANPELFTEVS